jgi:uncharacterized repeat protein (TIGR01451 family)
MVQSDNVLEVPTLKTKWKIVIALIGIIIIAMILLSQFIFTTSDDTQLISGIVFINGEVAPAGVNVTIRIGNNNISDIDGTDNQGRYQIDVTEHIGKTGTFMVEYQGIQYIANNQLGSQQSVTISESGTSVPLNLYIIINDDADDDDSNDSDDSSNDDETDDTNEDESDDDTQDDSENDEPDDEPQINLKVSVDKRIWHDDSNQWVSDINIALQDTIHFNVKIKNTGNRHLSDVIIFDELPDDILYLGNATIDDNAREPFIDEVNNTLQWNLTSLNQNEIIYIDYNCSIAKRGNYQNNVTVKGTYNTTTVSSNSTADVFVKGDISVEKQVWDSKLEQWSDNITVDVFDQVKCQVSIYYNGSFDLTVLKVIDLLPEGMNYSGNATINDVINEPLLDELNHSLTWENLQIQKNQTLTIEFDLIITQNQTFENIVQIDAKESIGTMFDKSDNTTVIGKTPKSIQCTKKVRNQGKNWSEIIDSNVYDMVQFNVTIKNIGYATIHNLTITDKLPNGLKYVNNSFHIYFENQTFYNTPNYNTTSNTLVWTNLNSLIQNYLDPGKFFSIFYNASIMQSGSLENNVSVTSAECMSCEHLTDFDTAIINAVLPTNELEVYIHGPYFGTISDTINVFATATGGVSPYSFIWDLDDDGVYDDGIGQSIHKKWDQPGNYTIKVKVIDVDNYTDTNSTFVNITVAPLLADAGGPYQDYINSSIQFQGSATGGMGNYTWFWDFGDGYNSTLQNPTHSYLIDGTFSVVLFVTDEQNHSANDTTESIILLEDNNPPLITLEKPIKAIYMNNRAIIPFRNPFIFGSINITFSAIDNETGIDYIQLYIDDALVHTVFSSSGEWTWDERLLKRCTIKIKAKDTAGNTNELEQIAWKFF